MTSDEYVSKAIGPRCERRHRSDWTDQVGLAGTETARHSPRRARTPMVASRTLVCYQGHGISVYIVNSIFTQVSNFSHVPFSNRRRTVLTGGVEELR